MTLPCQRRLFEIPDDVAYLNCAYMSPLLRRAREAGELGVGRKARPWRTSTADFFGEPERLRSLVARLVGGDADGVALIPSVSYGVAVAAANLPLEQGREVVLMGEEFPSDVNAWRELSASARGRWSSRTSTGRTAGC